jgi:hypothetical protein
MMKDLYTFDINEKAAMQTYDNVREVYRLFFRRLGLPVIEAKASSGDMGGSHSHEFHMLSDSGEDTLHICQSCGFAENSEVSSKPGGRKIQDHTCPQCDSKAMTSHNAIEIGHTFHLGTRYSEPLGAVVEVPQETPVNETVSDGTSVNYQSKRVPLQMGCHGIGLSRLIGAAASIHTDGKGLRWPMNTFPISAVIVFDGDRGDVPGLKYIFSALNGIHRSNDVNLFPFVAWIDDRSRPLPWKLKDAELVGYPLVIVLGRKWLETGEYEIQCRFNPKLSTSSKKLTDSVLNILTALDPEPEGAGLGERQWLVTSDGKRLERIAATRHPLNASKVPLYETNEQKADLSHVEDRPQANTGSFPIRKHVVSGDHMLHSWGSHRRPQHTTKTPKSWMPAQTQPAKSHNTPQKPEPTVEPSLIQDTVAVAPGSGDTPASSGPVALSRDHLLEKVQLLERLFALQDKEKEIRSKGRK